jgi:hypothetical protein
MKRNIRTKFKHLVLNNGNKTWTLLLPFSEKYWRNEAILADKCFSPLIKKNNNTMTLITRIPETLQRYRVTITLL